MRDKSGFYIFLTEEGQILYNLRENRQITNDMIKIGFDKDTEMSTVGYFCDAMIKLQEKKLVMLNLRDLLLTDIAKRFLAFIGGAEIEAVQRGRIIMYVVKKITIK